MLPALASVENVGLASLKEHRLKNITINLNLQTWSQGFDIQSSYMWLQH